MNTYKELKDSIMKEATKVLDKILAEELQNQTSTKKAICITVPKTISWDDYKKELDKVADGTYEMNFRLSSLPKQVSVGDRCYVCHNGFLKGWMTISNISTRDDFDCTTTGKHWKTGCYISRSGKFHYLSEEIPMKGFQGYKYIDEVD